MKNYLVSVIVPVYKVEAYVESCLKSITNQTYSNIEILVVDDGSPDKSGEICDICALEDTRIKVFHQKNSGVTKARQFALKQANGEYVAFVDSDDILAKDAIEYWLNQITKHNSELLITPCSDIVGDKAIRLKMKTKGEYSSHEYINLLGKGYISPGIGGKFYAKKLFSSDIFNMSREIKNNEDLLMNYRISERINKVVCCPLKSVYFCNVREDSASYTKLPFDSWRQLYDALFDLRPLYGRSIDEFIIGSLYQRYTNGEATMQNVREYLGSIKWAASYSFANMAKMFYLIKPNKYTLLGYKYIQKFDSFSRYLYTYGLNSQKCLITIS